jgi:hypothetical protein
MTFTLPEEALTAIAEKAAAIVVAQLNTLQSPWLTRKQAAVYLSVPLSRLEKDKTIPRHTWQGRILYDRRELDEFVRSLGNSRP